MGGAFERGRQEIQSGDHRRGQHGFQFGVLCHLQHEERDRTDHGSAVLTELASRNKEKLNWRRSIVDLMKLLKLDSGLSTRKELARELHYAGDTDDTAAMNVWLHKQVMIKLAENGGKVPDSLKV